MREASKSAGEICPPGFGWAFLTRLDGEVVEVEEELLFLEVRFAAERTCFASFSSEKMDCIFGRGVFERLSGLVRDASLSSLTLDMANGTGTLAS